MSDYGATDTSTTTLSANQFPVSAAWVPNDALRPVGGGPKQTDSGGKAYTSVLMYVQDGYDVTQGTKSDSAVIDPTASGSVVGLLKGLLTELIDIEAQTTTTPVVSGTVTANIGTSGSLALDTSVNGLLAAQGSTTSGEKGPLVQAAVTTGAPSYTTAQTSPLSLTTAGALRVDASATTQPISAASLPLPAGASTAAKQPALGTAGTASADVITVQGIASMTALKVDGSAVVQPVSGTFWQATQPVSIASLPSLPANQSVNIAQVAGGNTSNAGQTGAIQVGGAVATNTVVSSATNPLLIAGSDYGGTPKVQSLKVDSSGNAQVAITNTPTVTANAGTGNFTVTQATGTNLHAVIDSGTITANQGGAPWSDNITQIGGTNIVTGGASGLIAVGGPVASGSANADNPLKVGGAFNTTQPTVTNAQIVDAQYTARGAAIVATGVDTFNATINAALPAGGNTIGAVTQASGPWTNNVTQFGGTNVATGTGASGSGIPRVTVSNDSQVQTIVGTAGGSTPYHNVVSSGTNGTNVKNSAGQVYDGSISNTSSSAVYFRFYDTNSAPTVGTTTTKRTIQVPGNGTVILSWPNGLKFTTGISWGITTAIADNDTTAIGSAVSIDFGYA